MLSIKDMAKLVLFEFLLAMCGGIVAIGGVIYMLDKVGW